MRRTWQTITAAAVVALLVLSGARGARAQDDQPDPTDPPQDYRDHRAKIAQLQHEILILEAQLAIKKAEIEKAEAEFRLKRLKMDGSQPVEPPTDEGEVRATDKKPRLDAEESSTAAPTRNQRLRAALRRRVTLEFPDPTPLDDVLRAIRSATKSATLPDGLPIKVDPEELEKAGTTADATVTIQSDGRLAASLRRLLEPLGLTYEIADGRIQIIARDRDEADDDDS